MPYRKAGFRAARYSSDLGLLLLGLAFSLDPAEVSEPLELSLDFEASPEADSDLGAPSPLTGRVVEPPFP